MNSRKHLWRWLGASAWCWLAAARVASPADGPPMLAPAGGVFGTNPVVLVTAGAGSVHYSLDGTEVTTRSPLYAAPLVLSNSCVLRARAFSPGRPPSEPANATFCLVETNAAGFKSSLPLVLLHTFGRALQHGTDIIASIRFINVAAGGSAVLEGPADFDGQAAVKVRGYTSLRYPKKSYSVELEDAAGEGVNVPLLGLPADGDWVLYAPYPDKTLMRDVLAYEISRDLGRYASRTRFVEVFVNESTNRLEQAHYAGVYVLEEKVRRSKHRVNVAKLSAGHNAEQQISGGYILKKDHADEIERNRAATNEPPAAPVTVAPVAPARAVGVIQRAGFPTGPGGFPARPDGFLPPYVPPPVQVTNVVSATNLAPVTSLVWYTNLAVFTNITTFTNLAVFTNLASFTNVAGLTNFSSVTNVASVTNVTAVTSIVITTNVASLTNIATTTNLVSVTNLTTVTNLVVVTNQPAPASLSVISNAPAGTNVAMGAPTTVTLTNIVTVTNLSSVPQVISLTNVAAITNLLAVTNVVSVTNLALVTNVTQLTNVIALATNITSVIRVTGVTNLVPVTNIVALADVSAVTNLLVITNVVSITNIITETNPPPPARLAMSAAALARLVETGEGFSTSRSNAFFYVEPKAGRISPAQRTWLTGYVNRFEQALHGPDFRDPTNGYAAFIEVDSFIDYHLLVEATKNIDGFRFSTFYSKDRGGKIQMGPIWDWNLSLGNAKGKQGAFAEHWYWPQLDDQQYSWFRRLFEDPDFGQRYVDRWSELRTNVFAASNLLARIDAWAAFLQEPAARNFARWPILGQPVGPESFDAKTFEENVQHLRSWITNRLGWIDAQFPPAPVAVSSNGLVALSLPAGAVLATGVVRRIVFTLDGTDPRQPGGAVSPTARAYDQPFPAAPAAPIFARLQEAERWSGPLRVKFDPPLSASKVP